LFGNVDDDSFGGEHNKYFRYSMTKS